jgi:hypothetical protein
MPTLNDGVMSKLSAYQGTANDKQMQFLQAVVIAAAPGDTLDDLWTKYMIQGGYSVAGGTLQEQITRFMNAAVGMPVGLTTYNDIQTAYWNLP